MGIPLSWSLSMTSLQSAKKDDRTETKTPGVRWWATASPIVHAGSHHVALALPANGIRPSCRLEKHVRSQARDTAWQPGLVDGFPGF